ncbi:MAG: hypothetical protein MAG581_02624 [Deltaproteobacteria bacterium]|jgi:hypothetical protein|nr:hypothetical protein [Deltaproteobacteria bacterium]
MNIVKFKTIEVLHSWNQYLNEGNLSGILRLYHKSCVMMPTFSVEILSEQKQIKEYFEKVIEEQKASVELQHDSILEDEVSENIFILTGKYFFYLGADKKVPARFTFLIDPLSENPIKHHHSSQMMKT